MCGIAGFAGMRDDGLLRQMGAILAHRGPDGDGFYADDLVGLAHRRLSIIDLETGRQPLHDESGDLVLVANGEIYNYVALREELRRAGHTFATESDNEVIVHLYEAHGLDGVRRLEGMFAFALWDRRRRRLLLARDRLGIKPLCFARRDRTLAFASEAKALFLWEAVERRLNPAALDALLAYKSVPGTETMFEGVHRVEPGTVVVFEPESGRLESHAYWRVAVAGERRDSSPDEATAVARVRELLEAAVTSHMVSDVPVGATLSGGLDSSLVVALMARHSARPVKTFSIGFGTASDELHHARMVAEALGTEHRELIESPAEFARVLPDLLWHAEEPIAGALLPTYFLGRLVHEDVKVALVGEGADEVFGGYVRFKTLVPPLSRLPQGLARWAYGRGLNAFTSAERAALYSGSFARQVDARRGPDPLASWLRQPGPDRLNKVLGFEQVNELPNYQLARVDRLTMAFGVEARVPFLDRALVEYVNTLPSSLKVRRFNEKYILKQAAAGLVPDAIRRRRKQALSSPIASWYERGLREIAAEALSEERLRERGCFRSDAVRRLLSAGGRRRWLSAPAFKINTLMMVELWHQTFIDPPAWPPKDVAPEVAA